MSKPTRIAVVTGAGSGIGKQTALAFTEAGYSVVFAGRRIEPLKEAATAAGSRGSRTLIVPTDVSDPSSVEAMFARTKATYGRLDVLFNNAGTNAPPSLLEELTVEQWKSVVD